MPNKVMTAQELSEFLGLSYSNLRVILHRDASQLPPYFTVGQHKRWYLSIVEEWIVKNSVSDSLPQNARDTREYN